MSTDSAHIAETKGYKVDTIVFQSSIGATRGLYKIVSVGSKPVLKELVLFGKPEAIEIEWHTLLTNFKCFAGDAPCKLKPTDVAKQQAAFAKKCLEDHNKATIYSFAYRAFANHPPVMFCMNQKHVRADKPYAKGQLKLDPMFTLHGLQRSEETIREATPHVICADSSAFVISAPQSVKNDKPTEWDSKESFIPFWWVSHTDDTTKANMEMFITAEQGFSWTRMRNTKSICEGTVLYVFKAKVVQSRLLPPVPVPKSKPVPKRKLVKPVAAGASKKQKK
jgi:hypothetical protein